MLKHQHVIIWAQIQNPPGKNDVDSMTEWFANLIQDIGMKALMGPYVTYCDKKDNEGLSGAAVIETSHIALHVWDKDTPAVLQLDVYTCSDLELDVVFKHLERFSPKVVEYHFLDRDARDVCCQTNSLNPCSCSNPSMPQNLKVVSRGRINY